MAVRPGEPAADAQHFAEPLPVPRGAPDDVRLLAALGRRAARAG
ncbi:hypothetical protein [Nocardioides sp.]|nr:hypothetical protein [Nocardioides sp.]